MLTFVKQAHTRTYIYGTNLGCTLPLTAMKNVVYIARTAGAHVSCALNRLIYSTAIYKKIALKRVLKVGTPRQKTT